MKLESLEEVLRFAIRKEADAASFYRMMANRSNPGLKEMFEELAKEEDGHQKKLMNFDLKNLEKVEIKEMKGLGLSEMVEEIPFSHETNYAELLRMAIKNEERSQKLYLNSEKLVSDPQLKTLLLLLAQEESSHKERLEKIYEDEVLKEF
ncbi:MAG: ferritin family protein [Thermodesulfobacteriota bacterium]